MFTQNFTGMCEKKLLIPVNKGTKFTLGGEEYIIVRQEDILAMIS